MAMMNDPFKLINHLKKLIKQWMTELVTQTGEVDKDEEDGENLDKLIIDLRQENDAQLADQLRHKVKAFYKKRQLEIQKVFTMKRRVLKLKLQSVAVVDQLRTL